MPYRAVLLVVVAIAALFAVPSLCPPAAARETAEATDPAAHPATSDPPPATSDAPPGAPIESPAVSTPEATASAPDPTVVAAELATGVASAAAQGTTQYVVALDRASGAQLAATDNIATTVASESIMKLFIAAYYLRQYAGTLPESMNAHLRDMVIRSDDGAASAYWRSDIVPSIAAAYGMTATSNNSSDPGYWGATRITAADTASFLQQALADPTVGPWLTPAMLAATDIAADGSDQAFGLNAIDGAGSKQGWGADSYWNGPAAVHSVGFTDDLVLVVLQTAPSARYGALAASATTTSQLVVNAVA